MASVSDSDDHSHAQTIEEKNKALFEEIRDLCKRSDRTNPEVILLIGRSGAGKSAIVNTIHKVLTGKYFQIAKPGAGRAQSVTLDLNRYKNCGISLETIKDTERRADTEEISPMLPHIFDCAGLGDVNTPEIQEILELLIGGFIPLKTNIEALEEKQKQFGVGCLKSRVFKTAKPERRVTKVVFVQSCQEAIPKNLIQCLLDVLKIVNPTTLRRKYTPDVFLLITKYDLVTDAPDDLSFTIYNREAMGDESDTLTLEDFRKVESELAEEFNIKGAVKTNSIRWVSFTDDTGTRDNPYITNIGLDFLVRMLEPRACWQEEDQEQALGPMEKIDLHIFRAWNQIRRFFADGMQLNVNASSVILTLLFVVVIAVLYKLLSAGV